MIYLFIDLFKGEARCYKSSSNLETSNFRSKSKETYCQWKIDTNASLCCETSLWSYEDCCRLHANQWITYHEIMWWFYLCNRNVSKNTSSSSLAFINGCFLRLNYKLTAMQTCTLPWINFKIVSFWGTDTSWHDTLLLFCYTDFMATKTVAAATTISFADLKGLVSDQRNQHRLQRAHRDHRTLLMVGWVLSSSIQGTLAISDDGFQQESSLHPHLPKLRCVTFASVF